MTGIDIGNTAINRNAYSSAGFTVIDLYNPANADGILDTVQVWPLFYITGLRVGTFFLVSGATYQCRDSEAIGNVPAGYHIFTGLSIAVVAGDYIGCYFSGGAIECDWPGGVGLPYVGGEHIDPGDQAAYSSQGARTISLYGSWVSVQTKSRLLVALRTLPSVRELPPVR